MPFMDHRGRGRPFTHHQLLPPPPRLVAQRAPPGRWAPGLASDWPVFGAVVDSACWPPFPFRLVRYTVQCRAWPAVVIRLLTTTCLACVPVALSSPTPFILRFSFSIHSPSSLLSADPACCVVSLRFGPFFHLVLFLGLVHPQVALFIKGPRAASIHLHAPRSCHRASNRNPRLQTTAEAPFSSPCPAQPAFHLYTQPTRLIDLTSGHPPWRSLGPVALPYIPQPALAPSST